MSAAAVEILGIALSKSKAIQRQAERIGRDLGVGGFMALAIGMRADFQIDQAVLSNARLRHFVRLAPRGFEEAGITQATQLALRARTLLAGFKSLRRRDRVINRVGKAALLDREPHCTGIRKPANDVLAPQF